MLQTNNMTPSNTNRIVQSNNKIHSEGSEGSITGPSRRNSVEISDDLPDLPKEPSEGGKPVHKKNELSAEALKVYQDTILRKPLVPHIQSHPEFYSRVTQDSRLKHLETTLSDLKNYLAECYTRSMDYSREYRSPEFMLKNTHWPYEPKIYCLTQKQFDDQLLDVYKSTAEQWKRANPDLVGNAPNPVEQTPSQPEHSPVETSGNGEGQEGSTSKTGPSRRVSGQNYNISPIHTINNGEIVNPDDDDDDEIDFTKHGITNPNYGEYKSDLSIINDGDDDDIEIFYNDEQILNEIINNET